MGFTSIEAARFTPYSCANPPSCHRKVVYAAFCLTTIAFVGGLLALYLNYAPHSIPKGLQFVRDLGAKYAWLWAGSTFGLLLIEGSYMTSILRKGLSDADNEHLSVTVQRLKGLNYVKGKSIQISLAHLDSYKGFVKKLEAFYPGKFEFGTKENSLFIRLAETANRR